MTRHRLTWLLGLVLDLGLSPLTFYTGRLLGFDNLVCLLAGATAVTLRAGYLLGVRRRVDLLVGLMLATSLLGLAVALLTSDPRLVLLRDPLTSALIALVFLATCLTTRPALFHLAKRLRDNGTEDWDRRISTEAGFRRLFLMLTAGWAGGLLATAALRAVLIYRLPVEVMAGLSQVIELATIGSLVAWTAWFRRRQRRSRPQWTETAMARREFSLPPSTYS
ncbi:VC0807 family protein [Crossiella sp. CA198]|uniref:VC0807 family protein n=1 Tax=Crossiella sp. CA198 TaxID=3455607 RepID=UPI003F8D756B